MTKRKADDSNADGDDHPLTKKPCWDFDIRKILADNAKQDEEDRKNRDPSETAIWIHYSDRKLDSIDGKPPYRFSLTGPKDERRNDEWNGEYDEDDGLEGCFFPGMKPPGMHFLLRRWLRVGLPFAGGDWIIKHDHKTLDKAIRAALDDLPDTCQMYVPGVQSIILGYLSLSFSKLARLRYDLYTGMIAEPYDWDGNLLGWPPEDPKSDVIVYYDTDLLIDISNYYK